MSIENTIRCVNINELIETAKIPLVCPICSTDKVIEIPKSIISKKKNLTTVSIPNEMVCDHHFQAFIDQNFKVRGYQKVDYTLKRKKNRNLHQETKNIVDNLVFRKNIVQYSGIPSHNHIIPKSGNKKRNDEIDKNKSNFKKSSKSGKSLTKSKLVNESQLSTIKKKITLRDIYEDFWEYIDEDNKTFQKFIKNDQRRR